jgi:hypothetical protein
VSLTGDPRTSARDLFVCTGDVLPPGPNIIPVPTTLTFLPTGITKSSIATYRIDYFNVTSQTLQIRPQGGFGFSTTATGPFTTGGTFIIRTPSTEGSLSMWALFTATTTSQISANINHAALNGAGSIVATGNLRCVGVGKPHLAIYERGNTPCENIRPLQSYTFTTKQPLRDGDVCGESKIIRIEHEGLSEPITITAPEGYVLTVGSSRTVGGGPTSPSTFSYIDCQTGMTITTTKPTSHDAIMTNFPIHSSSAIISLEDAKYSAIFYDGSAVTKNNFEIWVTSVAPVSCNRLDIVRISSGIASTTLTITTQCQTDPSPMCVSDAKQFIPNDKLLFHTFTSSAPPLPLFYPETANVLRNKPAQWYICNPYNPQATIKVAEAWKVFDFQGSSRSMIGNSENNFVWGGHPDFLLTPNIPATSKVRYFNAATNNDDFLPFEYSDHATSVISSAAAIGNNGIGLAGIDWNTKIISAINASSYLGLVPYSMTVWNRPENLEFRSFSLSYEWFLLTSGFHQFYKQDMIPIASADNFGEEGRQTPNSPWVLNIGVSNLNDEWGGSNFGEGLDIVAAGADIMGAGYLPRLSDPTLTTTGDQYSYSWETISSSHAAPIVSGTVSLMLGYAREKLNRKYLSNEDIMNMVRLSADKVRNGETPSTPVTRRVQGQLVSYNYVVGGSPRTAYLQDGWDRYMGHGRLNVCKAMWYLRDGFLRHVTTAAIENQAAMPLTILTHATVSVPEIQDISSIARTPSTFATLNFENFQLRKVEVRKRIRFADVGITPPSAATIKVWGMGAKMAGNGLANLYQADNKLVLFDAGWCQPIAGTVSNTEAELQTFVYEVVSATKSKTTSVETFSNVWFPCKPEDVIFKYSVFGTPSGNSPCENQTLLAATKEGASLTSGEVPNRFVNANESFPSQVELLQNRPNPFAGETTLDYTLPERSTVRIEIVDVLGKRIQEPVNGIAEAGRYSVPIYLMNSPNGIYTVRMHTVQESGKITVRTRRMTLLK